MKSCYSEKIFVFKLVSEDWKWSETPRKYSYKKSIELPLRKKTHFYGFFFHRRQPPFLVILNVREYTRSFEALIDAKKRIYMDVARD